MGSKYTEAQKKATAKYLSSDKCHTITLRYQNDEYDKLKEYCQKLGKPVGTFIKESAQKYISTVDYIVSTEQGDILIEMENRKNGK